MEKNTKLYLAYGSNLNVYQMEWRCPEATIYGETVVYNYGMTFRGHNTRGGVANIEYQKGQRVKALVWAITDNDERNLDIYEGYPRLYKKVNMVVKVGGERVTVMAYIMASTDWPLEQPSKSYWDIICQGYRDCGWDEREFQRWVFRNYDMIRKGKKQW